MEFFLRILRRLTEAKPRERRSGDCVGDDKPEEARAQEPEESWSKIQEADFAKE